MSPRSSKFNSRSFKRLAQRQVLGLRNRVVLFFVLGATLLSLVLSSATYAVISRTLIDQRETLAERQAYINATILRPGLRSLDSSGGVEVDIPTQLRRLQNPTGTETVIQVKGQFYSSDPLNFDQNVIPAQLKERALNGTPARMRFSIGNTSYVAIGIPIPSVGATYFDITALDEVQRSLAALQTTLLIVSLATAIIGALVGRWSSRTVLRPLGEAATAAEAIVAGNRSARLTLDGDADMDRLVLSFNRMVDDMQGRIARDARFASDVSHELRSPLMTLASGISVLQARRDELPVRSRTALDLLADEVTRFQRMVQDLLEISRADADQQDIALDEVLAGEFVERVVEAYERDIAIHGDENTRNAILAVDKRRMERVIGNLIENADRYAGGVTDITLCDVGQDIQIVVEDRGPGVPPDERERIFERFARGSEARARASGEGTGLGLSLVSEHVALHHGSVWVEDRPGGGARFVVQLPKVDL